MPHERNLKEFRGMTEEQIQLGIESQRRELMRLRALLTKNPNDLEAQKKLHETLEQIGRLQKSSS